MKPSWRVELVQLLVISAMFAVGVLSWPYVPERLPVHWNLQGDVDRYGGKLEGLFLLPLVALGLYLLLLVMPLVDPGRRNYQNFKKAYNAIRIALVLFMALIYGLAISSAFGYQFDSTSIVFTAMGLLFIVLGNFMGKIRPNWFVGVRTPWTLSSKLSWDKTHRLAGWLFVLMGLLFLVLAIVPATWMFIVVFAIDGISLAWMIVYSYLVYRSDPHRTSPAATSPGTD
jgi:uncharacterized membrane protein